MDFKALMLRQEENSLSANIEQLNINHLPAGDVLLEVKYSSLNYKDAMAIGNRGIIRKFPAVPGIDLAGTVVESQSLTFKTGDKVILTGWGIGEKHWGGYSQYSRVKSDWLTSLPNGLSPKTAMQIGTAGLTAMLSIMALEENGVSPESGDILVTGASGGVGTLAIPLLSRRGYRVVALTGHPENSGYLKSLGASNVLERTSFLVPKRPGRFMVEPESYSGVVDTAGGPVLAAALSRMKYRGCIALCGLVSGTDIDTSVFPFILRAVRLIGIDSVMCSRLERETAWKRLAAEFPRDLVDASTQEIGLADIPRWANKMLNGEGKGRTIVNLTLT
jgi:acrylyl-CoA reductase (NADPH)